MKPTSLIPLSLLLLMVACSQTSAPNDTSLSPQAVISVGGSCSLIDAINAANRDVGVGGCPGGSGRDLIRLEAGHTYTLSEVDNVNRTYLFSNNGLPVITSAIIIVGNGATIERDDAPNTPQFRLFEVAEEGDLTLREVTVRNGWGGIFNYGHLVVRNSMIIENVSHGGIYNRGSAVLENSTVADNDNRSAGGGIANYGGNVELNTSVVRGNAALVAHGGGIHTRGGTGRLNVTESIIEDNTSGGLYTSGGGINVEDGVVTIVRSTIRNNSTYDLGGGLHNSSGEVTIESSTINGNSAFFGGGISSAYSAADLKIINSTVSGNRGGGIYLGYGTIRVMLSTITANAPADDPNPPYVPNAGIGGESGRLILFHSIVANQRGIRDCITQPAVRLSSEGFNLDRDGSCGLTQTSDQPLNDPRLGPLRNNGGPTRTHALLTGSPAINVGQRELDLEFDQRGIGFPRVQEGVADLGAFESVSLSEPDTLCGIPEGLWGLLEYPALYIRFCEVTPEPCFWQLCEAPPFLKLLPLDPCINCGWKLTLPRETSLRLNFRIDAFAKDPKAFAEAFAFGLYTPEGKLIRQGKLTEVVDPQTKEVRYALGLEANVSKGSYVVSVEVLDKKLWDVMSKAPKDYPFEFGFPNK